jgi:hypothetical protein
MRRMPLEALEDGRETRLLRNPAGRATWTVGTPLHGDTRVRSIRRRSKYSYGRSPVSTRNRAAKWIRVKLGAAEISARLDVLIEMRVDIVERPSESPFRQFRYTRPLSRAFRDASGTEDDCGAQMVGVDGVAMYTN